MGLNNVCCPPNNHKPRLIQIYHLFIYLSLPKNIIIYCNLNEFNLIYFNIKKVADCLDICPILFTNFLSVLFFLKKKYLVNKP